MIRTLANVPFAWSRQLKFEGYLFSCPAECQRQGTGERVEPGQEPQREFLVVAATTAAVELAQVHAAEVVFGGDRQDRPFTVPVGAVAPPARLGTQVHPPGSRLGDEAVDPHH